MLDKVFMKLNLLLWFGRFFSCLKLSSSCFSWKLCDVEKLFDVCFLFFNFNLILLQYLAYDKRKTWPSKTSLETWLCRLNKFVWTKLVHDSSNIGCTARRYVWPRLCLIRIDPYWIQFVGTRSNLNAPFCKYPRHYQMKSG